MLHEAFKTLKPLDARFVKLLLGEGLYWKNSAIAVLISVQPITKAVRHRES